MLVVPLAGDKISVEGLTDIQTVSSYSSLKKGGAIYIKNPLDPSVPYVSVAQVQAINKVTVTQNGDSMFVAKGLIKRQFNLPQVGDTISVFINKDNQGVEEFETYEVTEVRLTNKTASPIVIKCGTSNFTLADIGGITRKYGSDQFDKRAFRALYLDYMPIGVPS